MKNIVTIAQLRVEFTALTLNIVKTMFYSNKISFYDETGTLINGIYSNDTDVQFDCGWNQSAFEDYTTLDEIQDYSVSRQEVAKYYGNNLQAQVLNEDVYKMKWYPYIIKDAKKIVSYEIVELYENTAKEQSTGSRKALLAYLSAAQGLSNKEIRKKHWGTPDYPHKASEAIKKGRELAEDFGLPNLEIYMPECRKNQKR